MSEKADIFGKILRDIHNSILKLRGRFYLYICQVKTFIITEMSAFFGMDARYSVGVSARRLVSRERRAAHRVAAPLCCGGRS
jgi:hypothetical protein